jgi:predicted N-acetyltransferase YhbS
LSDYGIEIVTAADVLDLRCALLHRHLVGSPVVAGDQHPDAYHVAAYRDENQVAVGSIHPEPMPEGYQTAAWRLHGVTVEHGHRGVGVGALIVERCLDHAVGQEARVVWCVAPAGTFGFFERYGFQRTGDPIDDSAGPQYKLFVELGSPRKSWALPEKS